MAKRCTSHERTESDARSVSLEVLPDKDASRKTKIGESKSGKRRAIVLITIQLLMIAHVVQWLITGSTFTPIEPSESMEFSKRGVINAGLIFFSLALLSTLILGRWFCGWGCHVVMLQDGCLWFMKKLGIRPKPFRSRLLLYVPLLLALYMFIWPLFYRLVIAPGAGTVERLPEWSATLHLTTTDFWQTFPGVMLAIPFLAVCGFATVYFLGAKGFCTYGCPYGGFFAPLDEYAPGRIRVNDDCEQCGHCTAVCTSNVRVHEEVNDYGMVVDPGCMKCFDCVSVCPNDALYFGFGKPGILKNKSKKPDAPKRKRNYDLSWPEEIGMAIVFAAMFFAFRGEVMRFPLLMAAGTAGVSTFMVWKLYKMFRDDNVNLHRFRMRFRKKWRTSGWVYASITALVVLFTLHSGALNGAFAKASSADDNVVIPSAVVFSGGDYELPAEQKEAAESSLRWYTFASFAGSGGAGIVPTIQSRIDGRRIWLHTTLHQHDDAQRILKEVIERDGRSDRTTANQALLLRSRGEVEAAIAYYEEQLLAHGDYTQTFDDYVRYRLDRGELQLAVALSRKRLEKFPDSAPTMRRLAWMLAQMQDYVGTIELLDRAIEIDPESPDAYGLLAGAHAATGNIERSEQALRAGLAIAPDHHGLRQQLAQLLQAQGDYEAAQRVLDGANE